MKEKPVDQEIREIEGALRTLDVALDALRSTVAAVGWELEEGGEPVCMPNYRRAEQQLRTALNAAAGAKDSLLRRLALRRSARGCNVAQTEDPTSAPVPAREAERSWPPDGLF
jgi:hypothetical protein